jgi:phosphatidylserine/phosphatidylglycerophosphate/cardiolipin synthase-like enzyme
MSAIRLHMKLRAWLHVLAATSLVACAASDVEDRDRIAEAEAANTETACTALRDTKPGKPSVYFAPYDEPDAQVLCLLSSAKKEVVVAHYNIRREIVINKLIELKQRGVDVRVAVDQKNADNEWNVGDDMLEAAGIPLVRTKPPGNGALMHLKVTVIDGELAMTGSFNWNETAALANDENMVVFKDPAVVSRYRNQVLEILGETPRAQEPPQATPSVRVHFTPEQKTDTVIAAELDRASTSIDVAMFTYTNATIARALERAAQRGVAVRLVVEQKQAGLSRNDETAAAAGAEVVRGANRIGAHSAMHQKYAIIDGARVITGATNWTNAGTRTNEEDLLVIDDAEVAGKYRRNFADLMNVYGGKDITAEAPSVLTSSQAPVLFNPIHEGTVPGDRVVVVGSDPALGDWDPLKAAEASTHTSLFPSWTATKRLPAGAHVEYKFVTIRGNGAIEWEAGPNRTLDLPATGRAVVISGTYGDTSKNWTPRSR